MTSASVSKKTMIITAWVLMLLVSDLSDMIVTWQGHPIPSALIWGKIGILVLFLGLTRFWKAVAPLWQYALALLVLFLSLSLTSLLRRTTWFQEQFNYPGVGFFSGYAAVMFLDILVALAVLSALWFMKKDRKAFFLVKGQTDAPMEAIPWLGIKAGESWRAFSWIFGGIAALAVLIPTVLDIAPSTKTLVRSIPLLPAVLLLAAVNAFTEEAYFRCSLLSTLLEPIGRRHTLAIILVFFGLSHWLYGSPPGPVGFLMTGFLAWIMARSMLETRGLLSPWIIHFLPDVIVFFSYALLFVKQ